MAGIPSDREACRLGRHRIASRRTTTFSRRSLGKHAATLGVALGSAALRPEEIGAQPATIFTLRELADRKGFHLGALGASSPSIQEAFNLNLLNGGLHMRKLCPVSPDPNSYNFDLLDKQLAKSSEADLPAHAQHLVWGYSGVESPVIADWVEPEIAADGGDPLPMLHRHITTILEHTETMFPGTVSSYTVVNEPLNASGGYGAEQVPPPASVIWRNAFNDASAAYYGDPRAYIAECFKMAQDALAHAGQQPVLLINEWEAEQPFTPKGESYLQLVEYLVEQGLPMENVGVGFQMHLWAGKVWPNGLTLVDSNEIAVFAANFRDHALRFPAQPFVTEMSIDPTYWSNIGYSTEQIAQLRGELYYAVTRALFEAGGRTLMIWNPMDVQSRFRDDPASVSNQLRRALEEMPDVAG